MRMFGNQRDLLIWFCTYLAPFIFLYIYQVSRPLSLLKQVYPAPQPILAQGHREQLHHISSELLERHVDTVCTCHVQNYNDYYNHIDVCTCLKCELNREEINEL